MSKIITFLMFIGPILKGVFQFIGWVSGRINDPKKKTLKVINKTSELMHKVKNARTKKARYKAAKDLADLIGSS